MAALAKTQLFRLALLRGLQAARPAPSPNLFANRSAARSSCRFSSPCWLDMPPTLKCVRYPSIGAVKSANSGASGLTMVAGASRGSSKGWLAGSASAGVQSIELGCRRPPLRLHPVSRIGLGSLSQHPGWQVGPARIPGSSLSPLPAPDITSIIVSLASTPPVRWS